MIYLLVLIRRAYGALNVRSLLDVREQYLSEFQFPDPYAEVREIADAASYGLTVTATEICCLALVGWLDLLAMFSKDKLSKAAISQIRY